MKLSDFNKKPSSNRRTAPPRIVINNDAAEEKYKHQVDDLNTQLGYYRTIEAERDDAMRRLTVSEENLVVTRLESSQFSESIQTLTNEVAAQQQLLERIPELEEQTRAAKGELSNSTNELQQMTKKALEQSKTLASTNQRVDALLAENKQLTTESSQARSAKISAEAEFFTVSKKNKELESFTDETSKINKELSDENKEIKDIVTYWETEAREMSIQLAEAQTLETKLRQWVNNLETQDSKNTASKGAMSQKVTALQEMVTDMGNTLEDMMKELTYQRLMNREYRKELGRPKFKSMGAIAKTEGFVMPQGKENIRTHNLGNAAPTLLKFKPKKEESHAG